MSNITQKMSEILHHSHPPAAVTYNSTNETYNKKGTKARIRSQDILQRPELAFFTLVV